MAAAALLLAPTVAWYGFTAPAERDAVATSPAARATWVERRTGDDLAELLALGPGDAIPRKYRYLATLAADHLKRFTDRPPSAWRVGDLLGEYPDRSLLSSDIADRHYARVEALARLRRWAIGAVRATRGALALVALPDFGELERSTGIALDATARAAVLDQAVTVLRSRAARLSGSTSSIGVAGEQIEVLLPASVDRDQARALVEVRGRLTFNLADLESLEAVRGRALADGTAPFDAAGNPADTALHEMLPEGTVLRGVFQRDGHGVERYRGYAALRAVPVIDGGSIHDAAVSRNPLTGNPVINFTLTPEGGEAFYRATSANLGKVLAVVYDDRIKAQATISTAIRDSVQIEGFSEEECRELALVLKSEALPVGLNIVEERVLEPGER